MKSYRADIGNIFKRLILLIAKSSAILSVFSVALATMHSKLLTAGTCVLHWHTNLHLKDFFLFDLLLGSIKGQP